MHRIANVKNWASFQHYKDRSPPWIKLHRGFLDDYDFACLPIASKALAPMIWLLAAESIDGSVRVDAEYLAFRLHWPEKDVIAGLEPLIAKGFLIPASDVIAHRLHGAIPETETETETEKACPVGTGRFAEWWAEYPRHENRKKAEAAWKRKRLDGKADEIIADVRRRKLHHRTWLEGVFMHPTTYINGERWNDEIDPTPPRNSTGQPKRNLSAVERVEQEIMRRRTENPKIEGKSCMALN